MAEHPMKARVPTPPHRYQRREPLPWQRPKPIEEDPEAQNRIQAILESPSYRQADKDIDFLNRDDIRGLRLQVDYLKPELLMEQNSIRHTIVVFGGTRVREQAAVDRDIKALRAALATDPSNPNLTRRLEVAKRLLANSEYYDVARQFGRLVGSSRLDGRNTDLVIMTGGGPGIMEAANRGAYDVGAKSIGLNIHLPHEQYPNPYITPDLCFRFHYFALRKLHFLLRAKALVAFPGGYGTFDELFETLTLVQSRTIKPVPVVLVGEQYWRRAFNVDFLVDEGVIDPEDQELFWFAETAQEVWDGILHWHKINGDVKEGAMMRLSFHGADRGVTGSCHLIECAGRRVLIDCGMYQGGRDLHEENAEPFGFDPATIDCVLLTHAHLDHCGRLPLLVQRGFRGEIITTSASRELARLVLLDAAHLQEEEARYRKRKSEKRHAGHEDAPLYTTLDALNSFDYFGRSAVYGQPVELAAGVRATFLDAGHILGSASVLIELQEQGARRSVLFSGDLGNAGRPLLRAPVTVKADSVVMETTYGDRKHKSLPSSVEELYGVVTETFLRDGNVIIPTFALERAQELLYFLREGREKGRLPKSLPVFLDSPMAISATQIFEHHPECYVAKTRELFRAGNDPFHLPELHFSRETADSIAINRINGGAVIMAGSGMCTGGRIRHHLKNNLGRARASVVFVGYAAKGTLAREIIDGAKHVRLFGEEIPVRASIHTIGGFSAHADRAELLDWHSQSKPGRTFLVHGDEEVMRGFAALLRDTQVEMPNLNQIFEL